MKLSIIIPIYNAHGTLMRCVDSIVLQPVDKMELILVDDGSTDGSSGLCDNIKRQYEDENCEIKVIHKENGGLSSARNAGIAASTGELITFVDADDYLGRNTYSKQMEFFECSDEVDVVEFPVAKFYNDFLKKELITFTVDFYERPLDYLYETEAFGHAYACNKIFRREVLISSTVNESEGVFPLGKTFEDVGAMPKWLSRARRIVTTDGGFYFYTYNPDGICCTSGARQYADHLEALLNLMCWIPKNERKGKAYTKLFVNALNVRKDLHNADSASIAKIPAELAPSLSCIFGCNLKDAVKIIINKIRK